MKTLKALALTASLFAAGSAAAAVDVISPGTGWTFNAITYSHNALGASSSATLDILAEDVDYLGGERDQVEAWDADTSNWVSLGILTGENSKQSHTIFSLQSSLLNDVATGLTLRVTPNTGWAVNTITSTLSNVAAVPEPETYALFASGLGLLGWVGRRKRQG